MQDLWEHDIDWQLLIAFSHSNRIITRRNRREGLTPGQPKVLQYLSTHDGCTQQDVARGCALDKSTVAGLLSRMEADGLVARRASSKDRRETGVFLTEKGARGARIAERTSTEVDSIALQGLTEGERAELSRLLSHVIANLAEEDERA